MQTVTIVNHDYQGPTRNPNGEALKRLSAQFANVKGPEQVKKCLKAWGLADEISPRQSKFWNESTTKEKAIFCDVANVSIIYRLHQWQDIPEEQRGKLWRGILDVTQWGERLRGRF